MRRSQNYDLVGQIIHGQLIVRMEKAMSGNLLAIVRCQCGVERSAWPRNLLAGRASKCRICAVKAQMGPLHRGWKGGQHISLTVFNKFRRTAIRRDLEWSLTIADLDELYVLQHGRCALSGVPLIFDHGHRNHDARGNASLDRIDSAKGYVIDNIQLTTKDINLGRQCLSNDAFIEICRAVVEWQDSLDNK